MATIEKRVRNGETSYRARYRTPAGVQRSRVFARKIDAERFLTTVEAAKLTGAFIDPALSKATVREWAHQWLDGQAHVKPTTYARYEGIVRKHLDPVWGHVPLGKVTHSDVQAWITAVSKTHSPRRCARCIASCRSCSTWPSRTGAWSAMSPKASTCPVPSSTSTAISPTAKSTRSPMRSRTPPTCPSTSRWPTDRGTPTGSSCCSSPTPGCGGERWPHSASDGSSWLGGVP